MPYKIQGKERKKLRNELSNLKRIKSMWFFNLDLEEVYGTSATDQENVRKFRELEAEIEIIEQQLSEEI